MIVSPRVVGLVEFMDVLLASAVPADILAFAEHWRSARANNLVPSLSDFLDRPPFAHQRDTAIVDVVAPGQMRFRLFGTGLNDLSGDELTGSDVLSHFHPSARAEAERITWAAVTMPCGYLLSRKMRRGAFSITASGIGLPLLHQQSGRFCIVGFTSHISTQTKVVDSVAEGFVNEVKLTQWLDIGARTP
jgi:hypothetical protein